MHTMQRLRRSGIGVGPDRTIQQVAQLMNSSGVGSVAVIDDGRLLGIVTDRDIVRRGIARGLPLDTRIDGVMSSPARTIDADTDLHDAVTAFRTNAVRRLAVVEDGRFVGVISLDDLLVDIARDLGALTSPLAAEVDDPQRDSPLPVTI